MIENYFPKIPAKFDSSFFPGAARCSGGPAQRCRRRARSPRSSSSDRQVTFQGLRGVQGQCARNPKRGCSSSGSTRRPRDDRWAGRRQTRTRSSGSATWISSGGMSTLASAGDSRPSFPARGISQKYQPTALSSDGIAAAGNPGADDAEGEPPACACWPGSHARCACRAFISASNNSR